MRPPFTIVLIALLLGIWAIWQLWDSLSPCRWPDGVVGLTMLLAATGLLLQRTLAKYLLYTLTAVFSLS